MNKRLRLAIGIATAGIGAVALLGAQSAAAATTIEVTNTNDSGAGSLRTAIDQANNLPGPDQIVIEATGTIPLQSRLPTLTTAMAIQGPGASNLSLDGSAVAQATLVVHPGLGQPGYCYAPAARCQVTLRGFSIDHADTGIAANHGRLLVADSKLSDNASGIVSKAKLRVHDSTFVDNTTGLHDTADERTGVLRSTLRGNGTGISHGGAEIHGILLSVSKSTLVDNGNGITNGASETIIRRSTLARNHNYGVGNSGIVKIAQSTLSGNGTGIIGGEPGEDAVFFRSTIVANSDSTDCSGPLIPLGFNLADDGSCDLTRQDDQPNTEPQLRPLDDYGGPTKTFALSPTSPAIDAGLVPGSATTDQRELPRRVDYPGVPMTVGGDNSDIGSFELQAP